MKDREYAAFVLLNAPGFGAKSIHYVYNNLGIIGLKLNDLFNKDFSQLAGLLPEIGHGKFSRASLSSLLSADDEKLQGTYQQLKNGNIHIVGLDDERYPSLLFQRLGENAPPVLFCKGPLSLLHSDSISIVGSREVGDLAVTLTKRIANRLALAGYNVTSGFAKGVDTSAHIGALEKGGTTTMVLSYGVDHLSIKKDIKEYDWERNALFISQFMPYEKFSGQNAMIRNKLVCALSKAVIVISSGSERDSNGKMSGTFDAGRTAIKYQIPLFVLEPSLITPIPQGNIDLIKIGGIPLANANELVQHLDSLSIPGGKPKEPAVQNTEEPEAVYRTSLSDDIKQRILNVLNGKPLLINEIIEQTHLDWTPKKLSVYLKKMDELEITKKGRNNYYKKKGLETQPSLFA